jgi:hypothetical protein
VYVCAFSSISRTACLKTLRSGPHRLRHSQSMVVAERRSLWSQLVADPEEPRSKRIATTADHTVDSDCHSTTSCTARFGCTTH